MWMEPPPMLVSPDQESFTRAFAIDTVRGGAFSAGSVIVTSDTVAESDVHPTSIAPIFTVPPRASEKPASSFCWSHDGEPSSAAAAAVVRSRTAANAPAHVLMPLPRPRGGRST
jgi:hypothetical protein